MKTFVVILSLLFLNLATINAQSYKLGDRVEVDPMSMKSWLKGTIVKLHLNHGEINAADVQVDGEKDYTGARKVYTSGIKNLRPLKETEAEKQNAIARTVLIDKTIVGLKVDANNTVLADREILDCDIEQKRVKNGAKPDANLLGKLIRCLWEKPAAPGLDGAVTMDLTPIQIGTPHKLVLPNGDKLNTIYYPVKTTYTLKTFYRTRISVSEYTAVFSCYVNDFGEWQCGTKENKKRGETKSIPVQ